MLHVEDDPTMRLLTVRILERAGHEVEAAGDLPEAWAQLTAFAPDVVLLDVNLPGGSGLDLLAGIVSAGASVVVVTGFGQVEGPNVDMAGEVMTVLPKPFDPAQLRAAVDEALSRRRQRQGRRQQPTNPLIGSTRGPGHARSAAWTASSSVARVKGLSMSRRSESSSAPANGSA